MNRGVNLLLPGGQRREKSQGPEWSWEKGATAVFQGKILMGFGAGAGEEAHTLCTYLTEKRTDLGGLHVNCDRNSGSKSDVKVWGRNN